MNPTGNSDRLDGRGLILDYVGVLGRTQTPGDFRRLARIAGIPIDDLVDRYWKHRVDYDLGLPDAEYWHRVLGTEPRPKTLQRLVRADLAGLVRLHQHIVNTVRTHAHHGVQVGVLSNAPTFLARAVEQLPDLDFIDTFVFSCDISAVKPNPDAFNAALQTLQLNAADVTFVDDRAENIAAARTLGIPTVHLPDAADAPRNPYGAWPGQ